MAEADGEQSFVRLHTSSGSRKAALRVAHTTTGCELLEGGASVVI